MSLFGVDKRARAAGADRPRPPKNVRSSPSTPSRSPPHRGVEVLHPLYAIGPCASMVVFPALETTGAADDLDLDASVAKLEDEAAADAEELGNRVMRDVFGGDAEERVVLARRLPVAADGPRAAAAAERWRQLMTGPMPTSQFVSPRVKVLGADFARYNPKADDRDRGPLGLGLWTPDTLRMLAAVFRTYQEVLDTPVGGVRYACLDFDDGMNVAVDVDDAGAPTRMRAMDFGRVAEVGDGDEEDTQHWLRALRGQLRRVLVGLGYQLWPVSRPGSLDSIRLDAHYVRLGQCPTPGDIAGCLEAMARQVTDEAAPLAAALAAEGSD